jgi:hypothetical protein
MLTLTLLTPLVVSVAWGFSRSIDKSFCQKLAFEIGRSNRLRSVPGIPGGTLSPIQGRIQWGKCKDLVDIPVLKAIEETSQQ